MTEKETKIWILGRRNITYIYLPIILFKDLVFLR